MAVKPVYRTSKATELRARGIFSARGADHTMLTMVGFLVNSAFFA